MSQRSFFVMAPSGDVYGFRRSGDVQRNSGGDDHLVALLYDVDLLGAVDRVLEEPVGIRLLEREHRVYAP